MDQDFIEFADRALVALADEKGRSTELAPDLEALLRRNDIQFMPTWLRELPTYLASQGYGVAESTMDSWRFRIKGNGLARAAELRRAWEADAIQEMDFELGAATGTSARRGTAEARFEYLFDEAARELPRRLKGLFAEHSAKGLLSSGATVRRTARIIDELAQAAISGSLDATTKATPTPGRRRDKLLDDLSRRLASWLNSCESEANERLAKAARLERTLLPRLLPDIRRDREAQVEQYRAGWTAPEVKHWKERWPTMHALLLVVIGGLIGAVISALAIPRLDVGSMLGVPAAHERNAAG